MNPDKQSSLPRFPTGLLVAALVLTAASVIWLTWNAYDSNRFVEELKHRHIRCVQLQGVIIHLDEVLTMSARMAAATGDLNWEKRYRHYEPELDAAIKEAAQLAPQPALVQMAAQTDVANLKLVDMENRAFDLVHHGQLEQARAVLFSPAYEKQKQIYAAGITHLLEELNQQLNAKLHSKETEVRLSILSTGVVLAALLVVWFTAMRTLTCWRAAFRRVNDSLETRVQERTAQLTAEITERCRVEQKLESREIYYGSIVENMSDVVVLLAANGIFQYESPSVERVLGYKPHELVGKNAFDLIHPDDVADLKAAFLSALETPGRIMMKEYRILHKDGSWRTMESVGTNLLEIEDVNAVLVTSREVTARKQMEDMLRESEQRLKEAQVAAKVGDWEFDVASQQIRHWSEQIYALFGLDPANGPPAFETFLTYFVPEDAARLRQLTQRAIETGQGFEVDLHVKLPSGKDAYQLAVGTPVMDSRGKVTKLRGIGQDITERKHADEALRGLQRQQRALLDNIPDIAWVKDQEGRYVAVNEALSKAYGHKPEEIVGKTDFEMVPRELAERYRADDKHVMESRQRKHIEEPFEDAAGKRTWIDTIKSPIINDKGEVIGTAGIARDITERKKTEEEIRMLAKFPSENPSPVLRLGSNGTLQYANEASQPLLNHWGCAVGDCVPTFWRELVVDAFASQRKIALDTECGGRFYAFTVVPVVEAGYVNLYGRDITERKRAEEALGASEERYRSLFETMREGFALCEIICDTDGKPCDFRYLEVNTAFEEILGVKRSEALGKTVREVFPQVESSWIDIYGKVALTGAPANFENYLRALDKHFEVAAFSPKPGQFAAVFMDISERKQAEETMLRLSQRNELILRSAAEGIIGLDLQGNHTFVNPAAAKMLGYEPDELIGRPSHSTWHHTKTDGSPYPREECPIYAAFRDGIVHRMSTDVFWRKDGTSFPVEYTSTPSREHGGPVGTVVTFADITERKRADETLQESNLHLQEALDNLKTAQQQVIQQERLGALGAMASGIAHDFNNALAAILGFSELLLHRPGFLDDKEKARSYIEMMNTAAQDAGNVVNRLREFYRHREEGEVFVPVEVNRLVEDALSLTEPKWKAQAEASGISIAVQTDLQKVPAVSGNAGNLRQMLTNLIFNAVDAMPHGGTITIRTRRDDGHNVIEVADTGTGMTEEVRRRCLEPFFTTKGERGTGLGLSMVYGIIQRHEGTIDIQSEIGKGTIFIISLPHDATKPQVPEREEQPASPARSLRVLVVDDEPMVRKIIGEYLKLDGHVVEIANDGRAGLEKFRSGRFDLVLVDRAMPDMSGDQVASAIKSVSPTTPVVMLTGFGAMMDAADEKPAEVDLIIGKPVTIAGLRLALAKVTMPGTQDAVVPQDALATDAAFL